MEVKILPPRLVLHHLFSLAPVGSIPGPIQFKRCTLQQYVRFEFSSANLLFWSVFVHFFLSPCRWLEEVDDILVWELAKRCLEAYVKKVNDQGEKEFCAVYPHLISFGEWGVGLERER